MSAQNGNNQFLINYYSKVPVSTIIWSICRFVANSKWAIPLDWLEYCYRTRANLDKLWRYYGAQGIHLYDYRPKFVEEPTISKLFRGPDNVNIDSVIVCPYSGFPLKFSSWEFRAFVENYCGGHHVKSKRFFMDLSEHYYSEWQDEIHMDAWWGPNGRNKPVKKDWYVKKVLEQTDIYSLETYFEKVVIPNQKIASYTDFIEEEEQKYNSEEEYKIESNHNSDSDALEEYFKDNPLLVGSDNEEDPYRNLSDSDTET